MSLVVLSFGFDPYMIPNVVAIDSASASSPGTLLFMLVVPNDHHPGNPNYTRYKYWVFRGRTGRESEEYR